MTCHGCKLVAQYAPDVLEVIHPKRERIGTVQDWREDGWLAWSADLRHLGGPLGGSAAPMTMDDAVMLVLTDAGIVFP